MSDESTDAFERDMESMGEPEDVVLRNQPPVHYEFKRIVKETEKAWLLEMSGWAQHWFPKKHATLANNIVTLPKWLDDKMIEHLFQKFMKDKAHPKTCNINLVH